MKSFLEKLGKTAIHGIVFGLFATISIMGIVYATIGISWTSPSVLEVSSGSSLNASSWNALLANFNNLDSRISSLSGQLAINTSNVSIAQTTANTANTNAIAAAVPTGTVIAYNGTTCPTGWSEADGNGGRPNLQGRFIRGWNRNTTGLDGGRGFNTTQSSQNLAHTHIGATDAAGSHNHRIQGTGWMKYTGGSADVVAWLNPGMGPDNNRWTDAVGDHAHSFTTQSSGGSEVRPENTALLYCVKN